MGAAVLTSPEEGGTDGATAPAGNPAPVGSARPVTGVLCPAYDPAMSAITLEISAHRIGGADRLERVFQPRYETMNVGNGTTTFVTLHAMNRQSEQLRCIFYGWTVVRDGLMSAECRMEDVDGFSLGPGRPVLASMLPCDVPIYSAHIAPDPAYGVISLGLRSPALFWTGEQLATASAGEVVQP